MIARSLLGAIAHVLFCGILSFTDGTSVFVLPSSFSEAKCSQISSPGGAVAALSHIYRFRLGRHVNAQYSFQFRADLYLLHIFLSWLQFLDPLF